MAQVWDVLDNPATVESVEVACPLPSAETGLERRQWTERLWREIGELPPKQRAALLLNLRDQCPLRHNPRGQSL
jgi:DNA-directed RNA polymerase specialized sigma24 family protein